MLRTGQASKRLLSKTRQSSWQGRGIKGRNARNPPNPKTPFRRHLTLDDSSRPGTKKGRVVGSCSARSTGSGSFVTAGGQLDKGWWHNGALSSCLGARGEIVVGTQDKELLPSHSTAQLPQLDLSIERVPAFRLQVMAILFSCKWHRRAA